MWLSAVSVQLISLIENNSVVIIRGVAGSGKTTQLPQYILDHYNEKSTPCNIVVTQPRRIGATSIARWIATQRKCALGSLVGYQVSATIRLNLICVRCRYYVRLYAQIKLLFSMPLCKRYPGLEALYLYAHPIRANAN